MASTRVRLGTVQENGGEHPVLVRDDGLLPLNEALDGAPSDLRGLVAAWRTWSGPVRALADGGNADHRLLPAEKAYWCPPLIPPKLLCVGSNYRDHVAEMEGPAGVSGGPPRFPTASSNRRARSSAAAERFAIRRMAASSTGKRSSPS